MRKVLTLRGAFDIISNWSQSCGIDCMKKAYWAVIFFWLSVFPALLFIPVLAQGLDPLSDEYAPGENERTLMMVPYRSHAQFALDMILKDPNRLVGSSIDPDEYIIGPGDRFTIAFASSDISDIGCQVGVTGTVFIKSVGSVPVAKMTLGEAQAAIGDAVRKSYTTAEFDVRLTGIRFARIHVRGEVADPGIYYAPAAWRVSEVIELAGGLAPEASRRRIGLIGDQAEIGVDLLRFAALADKSVNPLVCAGHTIFVPNLRSYRGYVTVSGLVNRPGTFEAFLSDSVYDYLAYAGGIADELGDVEIAVTSPDGSVRVILDGAGGSSLQVGVAPGENITVKRKGSRSRDGAVSIFGAVKRPGRYPLSDQSHTLHDLLQVCGGVAEDGCREMIQVYRLNRAITMLASAAVAYNFGETAASNRYPPAEAFNKRRILISSNPRRPLDPVGLELEDGDSLYVPRATGMVSVIGAVASPGLVRHEKGKSIEYYLNEAGGLGFDADRDRIVVVNPVTGGDLSAAKAAELFDGEIIFVPRKENTQQP